MSQRFWILLAAAAAGQACGADGRPAGARLATVFDSMPDTLFARVTGAVPPGAVHRLAVEVQIAPAVDDTSLFTDVSEVRVDRADRLWVFDQPTNAIFLFDRAGRLIRRVGRQGGGPGEFNSNSGMAALADTGVAIWDPQNSRISFFDADGTYRTSWTTPSGFSTNKGLIGDRSGTLYLSRPVTDPREGEMLGRMGLVRLGEDGAFQDSLAPPDLPVGREEYEAIRIRGRDRSRSAMSSRYGPGYHWSWHPEGYFVVAHGGKYEIILARGAGKPITIQRDLPPVPVPEGEQEDERARIVWNMRRTDPGWTWSGPALPSVKAPLLGLSVTRDGRVWAQVAQPSERINEAELGPPPSSGPPVSHYRMPVAYEVFAPDGRFLARVDFPRRAALVEADGDLVWAIVRDEDGLPAVTRFRITPSLP